MFFPDPSLPYPLNQPWDRSEEDNIISNLLYSLDFSITKPSYVNYTIIQSSEFSDSAYMNVDFEFRFTFKDRGEKFAKSKVHIFLRRKIDGRWVITTWKDYRLDTLSFGELKFGFR